MATWADGTSGQRTAASAILLDGRADVPGSGTSLPTLPDANYPTGTLFCRTTDHTLWRTDNGTAWSAITASVAAGAITNNEVSNSAAIAYSKLALTGNIVNADISTSAAIDPAKVALPTPYGYSNDRSGVIISGSSPGINQIRLMRYTVEATRSYTDLTVFLTATSGNMAAGIYDTSATNLNLLGSMSATVACGTANTWQTSLTFSSSVPLTLGQDVFIAVHTDNATVAFGRTGAFSNAQVAGLPSGFVRGSDASGLVVANFNRGSFSAPLPNTISVASLTTNTGGFVFWLK